MKIAIIGSGNVGGALARQWVNHGHQVLIGARFPLSEKNILLAAEIGDRFTRIPTAVKESEVILISTPPNAILELVEEMGDVTGKVLIDATNAVRETPDPYPTVYHCLVHRTKAEVVKCFNSTGYENMLNPVYKGEGIDMFMAGDSDTAKAVAKQLALDCGFGSCIDFGKSDKVELLEKFALSWINLAILQRMGRNVAFRLVKR